MRGGLELLFLFLSHPFEGVFRRGLYVHETSGFGVAFSPVPGGCLRLRAASDGTVSVPIVFWRIGGHDFYVFDGVKGEPIIKIGSSASKRADQKDRVNH